MLDPDRTFKIKLRCVGQFSKFWLSQQWKRDCSIPSKLQTSQIWQSSFKKDLIDFYKLHSNRKP